MGEVETRCTCCNASTFSEEVPPLCGECMDDRKSGKLSVSTFPYEGVYVVTRHGVVIKAGRMTRQASSHQTDMPSFTDKYLIALRLFTEARGNWEERVASVCERSGVSRSTIARRLRIARKHDRFAPYPKMSMAHKTLALYFKGGITKALDTYETMVLTELDTSSERYKELLNERLQRGRQS